MHRGPQPPETALVPVTPTPGMTQAAQRAQDDLMELLGEEDARNTVRAYRAAWRRFDTYCRSMSQPSMPAESRWVASYLATRAASGIRPTTLAVELAALRFAHKLKGHLHLIDDPIITRAMNKIRAKHAADPRQVESLSLDEWERIIDVYGGPKLLQCRNRAIICVGLWCALRRSELGTIEFGHVTHDKQGVSIVVPRSKANKTGRVERVIMPYGVCPRRALDPIVALEHWLTRSRVKDGWLFRTLTRYGRVKPNPITGDDVYRILKQGAEMAGISTQFFGAHSMRVSYITLAAEAGVLHKSIMEQSRHKTSAMIDRYTRPRDRFKSNPMHKIAAMDKGRGEA